MNDRIEIPTSKKKTLVLLMASLLFVTAGVVFISDPAKFAYSSYQPTSPAFIFYIGILSVVFFGLGVIVIGSRLFTKKPGLIIEDDGVTDGISYARGIKMYWKDVEKISLLTLPGLRNNTAVMIVMKNPEPYIQAQTSWRKRKIMEANNRVYGSFVALSSNSLQISSDALLSLLEQKLDTFNKTAIAA